MLAEHKDDNRIEDVIELDDIAHQQGVESFLSAMEGGEMDDEGGDVAQEHRCEEHGYKDDRGTVEDLVVVNPSLAHFVEVEAERDGDTDSHG